jgi:hypothetical protein
VPWDLVLKAVAHHISPDQRWILLYAGRWLIAKLATLGYNLTVKPTATAT